VTRTGRKGSHRFVVFVARQCKRFLFETRFPNGEISGHCCDLADHNVEQNLEKLLEAAKPLDHIVFTAGDAFAIKPLATIDLDAIQRTGHIRFAVHLLVAKLETLSKTLVSNLLIP
jgi:NADP-dependent 3-hydroxy acid dehydrogenase YdfG